MTWADLGLGATIFALAAFFDVAVASWNDAVAKLHPWRASGLAVTLCLIGAAASYLFIRVSSWYLLPEAIGYGTGSLGYVLWRKRKH